MKNVMIFSSLIILLLSCGNYNQTIQNRSNNATITLGQKYKLTNGASTGLGGEVVIPTLKFNENNFVEYYHGDIIEVLVYEIISTEDKIKVFYRGNNDERGNFAFELDIIDNNTLHQTQNNSLRIWKL